MTTFRLLAAVAAVLLVAGLAVLIRRPQGDGPRRPASVPARAPLAGPVADALGRAAQTRTLADMRTIGAAYLARLASAGPAAGGGQQPGPPESGTFDFGRLSPSDVEEMGALLVPHFLALLPARDGWGHPYEFGRGASGLGIRSPGRDGIFSSDRYRVGEFPAAELDEDLVWAGAAFVRAPSAAREETAPRGRPRQRK